jgi:alpha,alpha-trehalose phosphorylase
MAHNSSEPDTWQVVEPEFRLADAQLYETLFALGNGYLGMRGTFEEGLPGASVEGTYINGFYESAPIIYGEKFIGYAENKQTLLNLANAKVIRHLGAGDSPPTGKLLSYRQFDLRQCPALQPAVQPPRRKQIEDRPAPPPAICADPLASPC